jgi:hypothetical protein
MALKLAKSDYISSLKKIDLGIIEQKIQWFESVEKSAKMVT